MRHTIRLALAALIAVAMVGCEPSIDREVLIVGDSITVQSADDITNDWNYIGKGGRRYLPSLAAVGGQGLTYVTGVAPADMDAFWRAHVSSLLEHGQPEAMIVSLGTNDCSRLPADYGDLIDNFMTPIPSTLDVAWLTLPDPTGTRTCDNVVNDALVAATARWPNLVVYDWSAAASPHPEWFQPDMIHLSTAGQKEYSKFLRVQLNLQYPR